MAATYEDLFQMLSRLTVEQRAVPITILQDDGEVYPAILLIATADDTLPEGHPFFAPTEDSGEQQDRRMFEWMSQNARKVD